MMPKLNHSISNFMANFGHSHPDSVLKIKDTILLSKKKETKQTIQFSAKQNKRKSPKTFRLLNNTYGCDAVRNSMRVKMPIQIVLLTISD